MSDPTVTFYTNQQAFNQAFPVQYQYQGNEYVNLGIYTANLESPYAGSSDTGWSTFAIQPQFSSTPFFAVACEIVLLSKEAFDLVVAILGASGKVIGSTTLDLKPGVPMFLGVGSDTPISSVFGDYNWPSPDAPISVGISSVAAVFGPIASGVALLPSRDNLDAIAPGLSFYDFSNLNLPPNYDNGWASMSGILDSSTDNEYVAPGDIPEGLSFEVTDYSPNLIEFQIPSATPPGPGIGTQSSNQKMNIMFSGSQPNVVGFSAMENGGQLSDFFVALYGVDGWEYKFTSKLPPLTFTYVGFVSSQGVIEKAVISRNEMGAFGFTGLSWGNSGS